MTRQFAGSVSGTAPRARTTSSSTRFERASSFVSVAASAGWPGSTCCVTTISLVKSVPSVDAVGALEEVGVPESDVPGGRARVEDELVNERPPDEVDGEGSRDEAEREQRRALGAVARRQDDSRIGALDLGERA